MVPTQIAGAGFLQGYEKWTSVHHLREDLRSLSLGSVRYLRSPEVILFSSRRSSPSPAFLVEHSSPFPPLLLAAADPAKWQEEL